ncbi:MAG TPA: Hsp33 family molecular chaperone HslO, partial [Candidatus Ventricola gallistercoris]|nr:Hsp33 family molecular chaperone HslO [Candidatus Ventricola gallistercoris]
MQTENRASRMLRLTLGGGQARVFLCDTTQMAQQARDIHHASNTCSAAMGRMIAAAAIMGANLKSEDDRITLTINGGGPAGPLCAVAGPNGTVKVTVEHPEVELPLKAN